MEWWGLGVGVVGVIVSIGGLVFAILAYRSANLAKNAAESAEDAANMARGETQRAIGRNLSSMDIERAVALINRLKDLHLEGGWRAALWLYQELRRTLTDIRGSLPRELEQFGNVIEEAVPQLTVMETQVTRSLYERNEPEDTLRMIAILSAIQQELETLQSNMIYPETRGGN